MSDFEQRLSEALADGAQGAPGAVGLAAAARGRAATKRRAKLAGTAALVALAIGVPSAVLAVGGDGGGPRGGEPADRTTAPPDDRPVGTAEGHHWESWHGVTVQVPDDWEHGSLGDWCADGGELRPRIQRPDMVAAMILCEPATSYGISFQAIDNRDDFRWPTVHQNSGGWPEENAVGGRGLGGVLIMVAMPDAAAADAVLDTMQSIGPGGDPNGCLARMLPGEQNPPEGALSVCRYDEDGALEQSEALYAAGAGAAVRALQAAPAPGDCDASAGSQPHPVVLMEGAGISARVDLAAGCPRVTVDGDVRELTADVLYWALSPGWSGDGTNLPLPPELRRE